jgi:hypothetical protein
MSDVRTVNGPAPAAGTSLPAAERDAEPAALACLCPDTCRACRQDCPESALIGHAVIQARCRRLPAEPVSPAFNPPGCPLCREARPAARAKAPAWRKGFRG